MAAKQPVINGETLLDVRCAICFSILNDPRVFGSCQHMFCLRCILEYVSVSLTNGNQEIQCPYCREALDKDVDFFLENRDNRKKWEGCFPKNIIVNELMNKLKTEDEYCKIHENKIYEHVCVNHSVLICSECLRYHMPCINVQTVEEYTPKYSKNIKIDIEFLEDDVETQLRNVQTLYSRNEECRYKLENTSDILKERQNVAQTKISDFETVGSADIERHKEEVMKSKTIYSLLQCYLNILATHKKHKRLVDDIVNYLEETYSMQKDLKSRTKKQRKKKTEKMQTDAAQVRQRQKDYVPTSRIKSPDGIYTQGIRAQRELDKRPKTANPLVISTSQEYDVINSSDSPSDIDDLQQRTRVPTMINTHCRSYEIFPIQQRPKSSILIPPRDKGAQTRISIGKQPLPPIQNKGHIK